MDASCFLNESADAALVQMIESVSVTRSLTGLLACADHRNAAARGKVVEMLSRLVHCRSADLRRCKELPQLLARLPKMLAEHSPEARSAAREIVRELIHNGLVSTSEMEKYVGADILVKCINNIGSGKHTKSHEVRKESSDVTAPDLAGVGVADYPRGKYFSGRFSRHFNSLI